MSVDQNLQRMAPSLTTYTSNTDNPPWNKVYVGENKWQKVSLQAIAYRVANKS